MDNLFEILVPLIIAAVYFFGNMLSNKSNDDATPSGSPRRRSEDADADAVERQRRIQEEIRRKIMERRRQAEGGGGAPVSPRPSPVESAPSARSLGERRTTVEQRRQQREQVKEMAAPVVSEPQSEAEGVFSWDESDNAYESEMQAKLKQIEATKRQAEKLKNQAAASQKRVAKPGNRSRSGRGQSYRGPVRESLRSPSAARAAFIFSEVLSPPISQRKAPSVPGLTK